jgi:VanZ family protein
MAAKKLPRSNVQSSGIHSTRLHVVLYSLLLVATPFVLLQSFLVEMISEVSGSAIELGGWEIPILPYIALILLVLFIVIFRSRLTKLRILGGLTAILMIALAQQVTDYYFGHNFYDLQQNWHYIAYGIFAFMMYRDLAPRDIPRAKIILVTFFAALLFSSFDETFQLYMSDRVFDISDTAKDVWGTLTGIVLINFVVSQPEMMLTNLKRMRQRVFQGYLRNPVSVLILLFVLAFIFLCYSSLMTDFPYWYVTIIFTVCSFLLFFAIFHFSQYKWGKYGLLATFAIAILIQVYSVVSHSSDHIVHNQYGLTVYKGIPIFFLDVMIFPDGTFRLVDKKHYFYQRDKSFFLKQKTDIIIFGSGAYGEGGRGFSEKTSMFIYNPYIRRGTQVIILKTAEACRLFNRLKRERKNVLFILHNTC